MIALAAITATVLLGASETGAAAQDKDPVILPAKAPEQPQPANGLIAFISEPIVQALPPEAETEDDALPDEGDPASLVQLVAAQPQPQELSRELNCLAGAVYFEARGESQVGQLAVARVVVARAKSGRFPDTYCGVVFQRSQFSFVRGHAMPKVRRHSKAWRTAVAIAQIAHGGSWDSPAEGALFFHAARVSPGWHLTRIARVDNHVFYR